MGRPKATVSWLGRPAVLHLAELLVCCDRRLLVVRADCDWVTAQTLAAYDLVVNPAPERGMLSSVQCGLNEASSEGPVLLTPVDCLGFTADTVVRLAAAARTTSCSVVPTWHGRTGHPIVLVPRDRRAVLAADPVEELSLARVLSALALPPGEVEVDDPGVLRNLNTPVELRQARRAEGR